MKVLWKLKSLGSVQKKKKEKERERKKKENRKREKQKKSFMVSNALSSNERIIDCF